MLLSEHIAKLIEEMIEAGNGTTDVRRNDLAQKLGCVPSQVSYVISSRFTPERGYITESRRGGGGYIRIIRAPMTKNEYLTHFFNAIGPSLSADDAAACVRALEKNELITQREAVIIATATSASALDRLDSRSSSILRADIMRHILMTLMR